MYISIKLPCSHKRLSAADKLRCDTTTVIQLIGDNQATTL